MLEAASREIFRRLPTDVQQMMRKWRAASKERKLQRDLALKEREAQRALALKEQEEQKALALKKRDIRNALATVGLLDAEVPDINHLLHHLRGKGLANLPKGAQHFVSVGCAGTWYFDWIEKMCGPLGTHTGVEFYSPRPTDLPANVKWIVNTAGNMPEIGNEVADILFSGQNIEHLWPEDIVGFLTESHRILKEGGLLVVDSPNRRITSQLGWSHPEHIIEFNLDEITDLLQLAGFEVEKKHGIWLCENPQTKTILPFDQISAKGPWSVSDRVSLAKNEIESSFIWWIEARKMKAQPQVAKLKKRVTEIGSIAWPERWNRLKTGVGMEIDRNGETWFDSCGRAGPVLFGPYAPVRKGNHTAKLKISIPETQPTQRLIATCDVISGDGSVEHARLELKSTSTPFPNKFEVELPFSVDDTKFAVQFRVFAIEGIRVLVKKSVELVEKDKLSLN